jgi:hypothetical protein
MSFYDFAQNLIPGGGGQIPGGGDTFFVPAREPANAPILTMHT